MNTYEHEEVIRAEREHATATEALMAVETQVSVTERRIAEKSAARAQIVAEVREGKLEEKTGALRLAILEEDVHDLQVLLDEMKPRVAAAASAAGLTAHVLRMAQEVLAARERAETERALDEKAGELEMKLLRALVERYRVSGRRNESLWNLWSPSPELKAAVNSGSLPKL